MPIVKCFDNKKNYSNCSRQCIKDPHCKKPHLRCRDKRQIYMTVDQETKFECLLKKDNIKFEKMLGIVIAGLNPIPGGFNKIIEAMDNDVYISIIDELGDLIIVPSCKNNICKYISNIENLF